MNIHTCSLNIWKKLCSIRHRFLFVSGHCFWALQLGTPGSGTCVLYALLLLKSSVYMHWPNYPFVLAYRLLCSVSFTNWWVKNYVVILPKIWNHFSFCWMLLPWVSLAVYRLNRFVTKCSAVTHEKLNMTQYDVYVHSIQAHLDIYCKWLFF